MNESNFIINGMTCQSCIKLIKLYIGEIKGVSKVDVKNLQGKTVVTADHQVTTQEVAEVLNNTHYQVVTS